MPTPTTRKQISELRGRIRTLAAVGMLFKPDQPEEIMPLADDFFLNTMTGVRVRLCSLSGIHDMTVSNVVMDVGGTIPTHMHDRVEQIFVLSGDYTETASGQTYQAGSCITIPPHTVHGGSSAGGCLLTVTWKPAYAQHYVAADASACNDLQQEQGTK